MQVVGDEAEYVGSDAVADRVEFLWRHRLHGVVLQVLDQLSYAQTRESRSPLNLEVVRDAEYYSNFLSGS